MLTLILAGVLVLRRIPLTVEILVVATLLAYGLNPIVSALSRKVVRSLAIAIVFAALNLIMLATALIIIPTILAQLKNLLAHSGDYLEVTQSWISHEQILINEKFGRHVMSGPTTSFISPLIADSLTLAKSAFGQLGLAIFSTVDVVIVFFTALVLAYYFLTNSAELQDSFLSFFPQRNKLVALHFSQEVERVMGGYISGQLILNAFCGIFVFLGLKLIHADYALIVGALTTLLYAIPYLGVTSVILLGSLFGLLQSWKIAAWSAVIIFAVTRVSDTLLVPKVMSKSVGVSPIAIILAVFAGGELLGLWGLVLAIPTVALVKVLWGTWLQPWLTGKPGQPTSQQSTTGGQTDVA